MFDSVAWLTLLHILVFVYWLGGDLGAFFSSYTLVDGKKPIEARMMALKVLNNVDMAPRTAIILAFPTGLTLAADKGWLAVPALLVAAVWIVALVWLTMVWRVHLKHLPPSAVERRIDMTIRWSAALGLTVYGLGVVTGMVENTPFFIGVKCLLLAATIFAGLMIRVALAPLFTAIREMVANGPTPEGDRIMHHVIMRRSKPTVVSIWIIITAAALVGIATPL